MGSAPANLQAHRVPDRISRVTARSTGWSGGTWSGDVARRARRLSRSPPPGSRVACSGSPAQGEPSVTRTSATLLRRAGLAAGADPRHRGCAPSPSQRPLVRDRRGGSSGEAGDSRTRSSRSSEASCSTPAPAPGLTAQLQAEAPWPSAPTRARRHPPGPELEGHRQRPSRAGAAPRRPVPFPHSAVDPSGAAARLPGDRGGPIVRLHLGTGHDRPALLADRPHQHGHDERRSAQP